MIACLACISSPQGLHSNHEDWLWDDRQQRAPGDTSYLYVPPTKQVLTNTR